MELGDEVTFTHNNGKEFVYEVVEIKNIPMNDFRTLQSGKWDLTLVTCDEADRAHRILVKCIEI
jgi:LPXTG-site transpeptidase (sortase) family protein